MNHGHHDKNTFTANFWSQPFISELNMRTQYEYMAHNAKEKKIVCSQPEVNESSLPDGEGFVACV